MKRKKIVIMGIDCLDYYLVKRWKQSYYMLDHTGYHFVGLDLYTPIIWAKFLCGIDVTKHGFNSKRLSKIKRIKSLFYIRQFFDFLSKFTFRVQNRYSGKTIEASLFNINIKRLFSNFLVQYNLESLSLYERMILKLLIRATYSERLPKRILKNTFIYSAMHKGLKVLPIEFPSINDNIYSLIRNMLYFYIDASPNDRQVFLEHVWRMTEVTLDILLKNFNDYDLILWYTPYIDIASHLFYKPGNIAYMTKLYAIYKKLGKKIENTISRIYSDAIVLIVSDHGYNPQKQDHSHFGYWSINVEIDKYPRVVLDFASMIMEIIDDLY